MYVFYCAAPQSQAFLFPQAGKEGRPSLCAHRAPRIMSTTAYRHRTAFVPAAVSAARLKAEALTTPLLPRTYKRVRARANCAKATITACASDGNNSGNADNTPASPSSPRSAATTDEDERLQNDRRYIMGEFGKKALGAIAIGFILFCFDILVSLVVFSIAALYGVAVLLDLRFITDAAARMTVSANSMTVSLGKRARNAWSALRRRLRKGFNNN